MPAARETTVVFYCQKEIFYLKNSNLFSPCDFDNITRRKCYEEMPNKWINQSREWGVVLQMLKQM